MKNQNILQSLLFIKATAWVILGISSMFSVYDLTIAQSGNLWLSTFIKFGMALAFLFVGGSFQRNQKIAIWLLVSILIIDVVVNMNAPIGIFDVLMLLFDLVLYWLVFGILRSRRYHST